MKEALIVIDVQEAFWADTNKILYNGDTIVDNVNFIIDKHRKADNLIIFIQHTSDDPNDAFCKGSKTWILRKGLNKKENDIVVLKYSWDAFLNTNLKEILEKNTIDTIHFVGIQTDFCVDTTLRNAYSLGYKKNYIYKNAHTTFDDSAIKAEQIIKHHECIWNNRFAKVIETDEYFK
jgi:nicotinamidase-related amidase